MKRENKNTTVATCSMTWQLIPIEMHMTYQTIRRSSIFLALADNEQRKH